MLKVREKSKSNEDDIVYAWQCGMREDDNKFIQFMLNSGCMSKYQVKASQLVYIIDDDNGFQWVELSDWVIMLEVHYEEGFISYIDCVVIKDAYFREKYDILGEM